MIVKNRSKAWGKKTVNVKHLSGLMIAYGGLRTGQRNLVDDYLFDYRALSIPALLNNKTGKSVDDMYDDFLSEGWILPMDDSCRDAAAYFLDLLKKERSGKAVLTCFDLDEYEHSFYARNQNGR